MIEMLKFIIGNTVLSYGPLSLSHTRRQSSVTAAEACVRMGTAVVFMVIEAVI